MTSICLQDWEIRALQEGRKTQVRVLVKPQPPEKFKYVVSGIGRKEEHPKTGFVFLDKPDRGWPECEEWPTDYFPTNKPLRCPFGGPGDKVFVKHTHYVAFKGNYNEQIWDEFTNTIRWRNREAKDVCNVRIWEADGLKEFDKELWTKRSPVIMPEWASRFTLEIVSVRVERVNEISEEDARAEGVFPNIDEESHYQLHYDYDGDCRFRMAFERLWKLRHPGSWQRGDWVWVVEVKRV